MKEELRKARTRLQEATRTEYNALVYEAKLTPLETRILNLHIINDMPIITLAERFSCSIGAIRNKLERAYERVSRIPEGYDEVIDWRTFI